MDAISELTEQAKRAWSTFGVERAERNVSIDNICRLAAAVGADPSALRNLEMFHCPDGKQPTGWLPAKS